MIAGLVPVKRLGTGKSRLRSVLAAEALEQLTLAMLDDVLDALRGAPGIGSAAVVTEDPRVAEAARRSGARAILRRDEGLNASLDAAASVLAADGAAGLLVVLGDVPGISADDVSALLAAAAGEVGAAAALAPARDGGTTALLRRPHDAFASGFGRGSAERHRALARAAGVPLHEVARPGLQQDLDRPADLEAFLAGPGPAAHTRALLERLGPRLPA